MRTDALDTTVGTATSPDPGRTPPPRTGATRALPVFVGGLVLGTSMAVAAVSWWLVPPYLALMAFLLFEPSGRRVIATNPAGPESAPSEVSTSDGSRDPAIAEGPDDPPALPDATPPPKAGRGGKGRGSRKARRSIEPAPATWVQVAPGKFVRVEPGTLPAEPGPHSSPPPDIASPTPLAASAEAMSGPDEPGRPPADPGPHDAPTEAALDASHPESTPAEGPAPEGPRDPLSASEGSTPIGVARDDPSATDRDVTTDPGLCPGPGAPRVEAAGPDPIRDPEAPATIAAAPDPAAGPQPEASAEVRDVAEAGGDRIAFAAPSLDESAGSGDGTEPDLQAEDIAETGGLAPPADAPPFAPAEIDDRTVRDVADEPEDEPGDPSRGRPPEAAGAPTPDGTAASWFGRDVPPPRRNVRPAHPSRRPNGLRLRSRRGDGRPHHFARAFPPRSPPRRGLIRVISTRPPSGGACPFNRGASRPMAFPRGTRVRDGTRPAPDSPARATPRRNRP